jgi:hypothetical protein
VQRPDRPPIRPRARREGGIAAVPRGTSVALLALAARRGAHAKEQAMNDSNGGASRKPPLTVLAVIEKPDAPTRWMKLGVAFPNRDGSTTIYLDALPAGTNKLQIREEREWTPRRAAGNGNGFPAAPPFDVAATGSEAES